MKKILVIDDEEGVRESLKFSLKDKYRIFLASTGKEGIDCIEKENPDLVILDILLPDKNGLEILKEIKKINEDIPVIMLTAVSQVKTAVEAMKLGAIDYITKPYDVDELLILIKNTFKNQKLKQQINILKEEINEEYPVKKIVFRSKCMKEIIDEAKKLSFTDSTVLLLGPTGVGKELIARVIHYSGPRKEEPFVPIHCAAIPETLFESELFGHEKGAFTNAFQRKIGKFELAGKGTIFLDEVSEIPLSMQTKLLRFLEEKKFT
ncbi:MAG: two-component system response regulator, partial [Candidatus Omnitrophota bacterium]